MKRSRDAYTNGGTSWAAQDSIQNEQQHAKRRRTNPGSFSMELHSDARSNQHLQQNVEVVDFGVDDENEDVEMPSEEERARHAVMMQIVTGRQERTQDPVDRRLEQMIRHSRMKATRHTNPTMEEFHSRNAATFVDEGELTSMQQPISNSSESVFSGKASTAESAMDVEYSVLAED